MHEDSTCPADIIAKLISEPTTRHSTRPVRDSVGPRRRRDGRGLPSARHAPRPHRRYQNPVCRRSRPTRTSASASSAKRTLSRSSIIRISARSYDVGDARTAPTFLVMEYLEGETLARAPQERGAAARPGAQDRDPDRRRARRRAPCRHRPPRSEAGQHHAYEERREAARLRAGEEHSGRCVSGTRQSMRRRRRRT